MTEDQARTKWCPFARGYTDTEKYQAVTVNRDHGNVPDAWCLCMASNCMAWRWNERHVDGYCGLVR